MALITELRRELQERRDDVAQALERDHNGRRQHDGRFKHSCLNPDHDDPGPSAYYDPTTGGYKCFGCDWKPSFDEIVKALANVMPVRPSSNGHAPKQRAHVVRRIQYEIRDATGQLAGVHGRIEYDDGSKEMPWRQVAKPYMRDGKVAFDLLPLYGADLVGRWPKSEPVTIVEGEKCADVLRDLGVNALGTVCTSGSTPCRESLSVLRSRSVELWPDNDDVGRAHMGRIGVVLLELGCAITWLAVKRQQHQGYDVADLVADHGDDLEELQQYVSSAPWAGSDAEEAEATEVARERSSASGFDLVSVDDLLDEEDADEEYVIEDLLPAGGFCVIGAKPKTGKSVFVREACACVALGEEFLSRNVQQGPVIYVSLEEHRRTVRKHFRALIGSRRGVPLFTHFGAAPQDAIQGLAKLIETYKPVLVAIDPLFKFARVKDESSYAEVTRALEPVLALARETSCHILVSHHNTKVTRGGGDDLLGSTAIFGNVDVAIVYQRKADDTRVLYTIQRDGKDMPATVAKLDETGSLYLAGSAREAEQERLATAIVAELKTAGAAGLTKDQLVEKVGKRRAAVLKAADELYDAGTVYRHGDGAKGNPVTYWMQPPATDSVPEFPRATETASEGRSRRPRSNTDTRPNAVPAGNRPERNPSSRRRRSGTASERNLEPAPVAVEQHDTADAPRQDDADCPDCGHPLAPMSGGPWCIGCSSYKTTVV